MMKIYIHVVILFEIKIRKKTLLVRHMVFVGNVQKSPIASHLKGLDPSLDFCIIMVMNVKKSGQLIFRDINKS